MVVGLIRYIRTPRFLAWAARDTVNKDPEYWKRRC